MKNSEGRGVIRLGDKTTHGGTVVSAQPTFKVLGKAVAVEGDLTTCPQCKGTFPIQTAGSERHHDGRAVAYNGDKATCGAKLISSI
ncbi:PAAR domain-containing protein [Duganella violaceipulchra]|uniref:PAAR domain-containing protein n=1 Tax=Duganella violaceipulchra TaxID=2849652 RepID=A0AA41HDW8_9BURK|nr:PAAR domain-containing protein [Duganella violaceicalia]MBV6325620.1 PAAR domain-containing protein [Duganella violaceicalia]